MMDLPIWPFHDSSGAATEMPKIDDDAPIIDVEAHLVVLALVTALDDDTRAAFNARIRRTIETAEAHGDRQALVAKMEKWLTL